MNTLSWIILLGHFASMSVVLIFVFGVATIGTFIAAMTAFDLEYRSLGQTMKRWCIFFLLSTLLMVILPKRDTIYLIAASEFGQGVVESEFGTEVINEAKEALMFQLKRAQGE